jgi:hypothetical protein
VAYEAKPNTGSLFKNDKMKHEKSPAYTGTVNIDGVEYYQSAWINETKDGRKYFSQKFNRKDAPVDKPKQEAKSYDLDEDTIPF